MTTQELEYLIKVNDRDLRELRSRVKDTNKALGDETAKASSKGSSGISKLSKVAKGAVLGLGTAAGVGLAWAAKTGFDEFKQGQQVAAQTAAVLKSTGGAAGVSAEHISDLAGALLKKSGVDDEAIQSGENLLLTFTNIRNEAGKGNDIFDQTTRTMLDMSVALGQDTKSSAIQLGKALNDPIKGITALQRVGVSFTQGQRDQIKALVESGHTLEAQKLILGELNKEFGGSAEAAGKTLPGAINIARETVNNWLGELVGKAIPVLTEWVSWLRDHWPEISAKIAAFWKTVEPLLAALYSVVASIVRVFVDHWGTIGPIVDGVARVIEQDVKVITSILRAIAALLRGEWSGAWNALKDAAGHALDGIKARVELAGRVGGELAHAMGALASTMVGALLGGLEGLGGKAWGLIDNIGGVIAERAGAIAGWGASIGSGLISGIVNGLKSLGSRIVGLIKSAVNAVIDQINHALEFHVSVNTHVPGVGKVGFDVNPPDIPHLAAGGPLAAGQVALVGEKGPELFVSNRAGTVIPNGRAGFGGNVIVERLEVRDELDVEAIAGALARKLTALAPA